VELIEIINKIIIVASSLAVYIILSMMHGHPNIKLKKKLWV